MSTDQRTERPRDGKRRRLANLRPPFKPGQSGNPSGLPGGGKRAQLLADFSAELGGNLSAIDAALLARAVDSLIDSRRRSLTSADRTKALNTANRIIGSLRDNAKAEAKAEADDFDVHAVLQALEQAQ